VTDCPVDHPGRVLLVQREVATRAELDALVAEYVAESERRGEPARRAPAQFLDGLTGALAA